MTSLLTSQIKNAAGVPLDTLIANMAISSSNNSITLPDGTILKYGTIGSSATIAANGVATLSVVFPAQFPTECDYFGAILTPAASTDFYGVTSLVSRTATGASFTVRNGATAQTVASGVWFAIGK
jgi:hypothetical protein